MPEISLRITIAAPAEKVWEMVAHHFDRVDEWATVVHASYALPGPPVVAEAPVAGRVCRTGLPVLRQVSEHIVAYDEIARTLTYQAELLPGLLPQARNQWEVIPVGPARSQVTTHASVQTHGILGALLYVLVRPYLRHAGRRFLRDLRRHLEHAQASAG
ncbi:SRPBCC family protein [Nonomuraea polychroma]|uniref:SRPBCC family protein n=1 Tax=Nonomuraea polychroma TaxID=46176 RepID=UPI003D8D9437